MTVFRAALIALCLFHVGNASEPVERKPWVPSPNCPPECTCSASSLSTMRIPPPKINRQMAECSSIPRGPVSSSIYSIKVHGEIERVTPALLAKLGKTLQVLDLSDCKISHIMRGSFDKLTQLTVLKLSNNKLESIDRDLFKKMTQLKTLFLDGNLIKEIQPGTFAKCNNLEELHLQMNQLREFPTKLPQKLTTLDISHNVISAMHGKDMGSMHLKLLNLCYNHVAEWSLDVFSALRMIQDLCLGAEDVVLPAHTADKITGVVHLKLIAELEGTLKTLNHVTQEEIGKMNRLTTLTIENYQLDSLAFLLNHTNLMELQLVNVVVTSTNSVEMKQLFHNNPYLTKINFNRSPALADILVNNIYMVANLHDLQRLSMQSAGIVHLPVEFNAPNSNFRLDISHNELHCDCQFQWLHRMDEASMHYLLACSENTTCHSPEDASGKTLEDFVKTVDCTTQPHVEEPEPTEMFIESHDEGTDDVNVREHGQDGVENGDDQQTDEAERTDEAEQTGETEQTDDVDQTNQNEEDQVTGDNEETGETGQTGDEADQTNQNEEDQVTGDNEQTGETGETDTGNETDVAVTEAVVEGETAHGTDYQETVDSSEKGTENVEGDQEMQDTNKEDGTGENEDDGQITTDEPNGTIESDGQHSHHHKQRHHNDEHAKIYIVLGCVLLVLVLIGVILGAIYWKYKQDGKNKVAPGSEEAPHEPIEPTYKQTLASEDTTLIKK